MAHNGESVVFPDGFAFSQSNISDWLRCKRLFQYRHLQRRAHPAPETTDLLEYEEHTRLGTKFHTLAQQLLVGVPVDLLTARIHDPNLAAWWGAFQKFVSNNVSGRKYTESFLSAPLGNHRLVAKFDLISVEPESKQITIYDWKTSPYRPPEERLRTHPQTRVYLYLMAEAGGYYVDGPSVSPDDVRMIYWYAAYPDEPIIIDYSHAQHEQTRGFLAGVVDEISGATDFPKVDADRRQRVCRYCVYRNLCWDDVSAGNFDEYVQQDELNDADPVTTELELDFDQIAEVEF